VREPTGVDPGAIASSRDALPRGARTRGVCRRELRATARRTRRAPRARRRRAATLVADLRTPRRRRTGSRAPPSLLGRGDEAALARPRALFRALLPRRDRRADERPSRSVDAGARVERNRVRRSRVRAHLRPDAARGVDRGAAPARRGRTCRGRAALGRRGPGGTTRAGGGAT